MVISGYWLEIKGVGHTILKHLDEALSVLALVSKIYDVEYDKVEVVSILECTKHYQRGCLSLDIVVPYEGV